MTSPSLAVSASKKKTEVMALFSSRFSNLHKNFLKAARRISAIGMLMKKTKWWSTKFKTSSEMLEGYFPVF